MKPDNSKAREAAVQYLYQCEAEKVFFFAPADLKQFIENFQVTENARGYLTAIVEGVFDELKGLDEKITGAAENWSLSRMAATDRNVLRVAVFELSKREIPPRIVIDEAINLARKFGAENSAKFVNGILDKIHKS